MKQHLLDDANFFDRTSNHQFFFRKKHSKAKIIFELMKKQIKVRFRNPTTYIETFFCFFLFLLIIPIQKLSVVSIAKNENPNVFYNDEIPQDLINFFNAMDNCRFVLGPKTPRLTSLMNFVYSNFLRFIDIQTYFANDTLEIKKLLKEADANGIGIFWENSEQDDYLTHPKFQTFTQCITTCPNYTVLRIIRSYLAVEAMKLDPQNVKINYLSAVNSSIQQFASNAFKIANTGGHINTIFSAVTALFCFMPDYDIFLIEKDSKTAALCFLMGCNEWIYNFVTIFVSFLFSLPPFLTMSLLFCFYDQMKDISFSIVITFCLLYSISYIIFSMFISTFFKNLSSGRFLTVLMATTIIILGFIHQHYTLELENPNLLVKHLFSIIPPSAFMLIVGSIYKNNINDHILIKWSNLSEELPYKISTGIFYLITDTILYSILFYIFNMINQKKYGSLFFNKNHHIKIKNILDAPQQNMELNDVENNEIFFHVSNLSKSYGKNVALNKISFDVYKDDLIVITGPNGAGKTTLINILSGILKENEGVLQIYQNNDNIALETSDFSCLNDYIGVVFQENVFIDLLTVRENLKLFGSFKGVQKHDLDSYINNFANIMQMTSMLDTLSKNLSGGQKRKLCIGIALIGNPLLVLMDEPTSGVDVQSRLLIWKTITSLSNTTTIVTSHALEEAESVASRIFILSDGQIPFIGTTNELRNTFKCGYLMRFQRGPAAAQDALKIAVNYMPNSKICDTNPDTLILPVDPMMKNFLEEIYNGNDNNFGEYTLNIEQLEDIIFNSNISTIH